MESLYVLRGRDQGKHFPLSGDTVSLGRDSGSDIQLLDSEASRKHASMHRLENGRYLIQDHGSSNGTLVNGIAVDNRELHSGDRIQIGQSLLIFTGGERPTNIVAAHAKNLAQHGVDIVGAESDGDASRIIGSVTSGEMAARLSGRSAPRNDETNASLQVMYETALAVGRTSDIDQLLDRILQLVFDWVAADRGCIMLRDTDTGELRPAARRDRRADSLENSTGGRRQAPITISHTILDFVIDKAEGVRTTNATKDGRFDGAQSIMHAGVREAICVPLQGRYEIVGALYVDTFSSAGQLAAQMRDSDAGNKTAPLTPPSRFTDQQLRLMTAIGHSAALAIEDSFYYSAMMQSERLAAMGQTIATLSHHIKNILQGIQGGGYLISAGLDREDNDAVRRGWTMVERNQE
ncbi:MAG: FHA domain-containing protein, partial [Planctomycetota bacterium]